MDDWGKLLGADSPPQGRKQIKAFNNMAFSPEHHQVRSPPSSRRSKLRCSIEHHSYDLTELRGSTVTMQSNRGVADHGAQEDGVRRLDAVDQLAADLAAFRRDGEARLSQLEQAVSSGISPPGAPGSANSARICPKHCMDAARAAPPLTCCTAVQTRILIPLEHGLACRPK